jgi:hypothetical protein
MTKKNKPQLCLAAVTDNAVNPVEAAKVIRAVGGELHACLTAMLPDLEEPLKTKWGDGAKKLQTALASLPADNAAPDTTAQVWPAVMATAQAVIGTLQETNKDLTGKLQTTLAGIPAQVTSTIDAKIKAGELIAKADHNKAVSDAISAAVTAARASALTEYQRIATRRTQLTTASIPVPADEVIAGEDAAFDAKKGTATKRLAELAPYKLDNDRVLALCWNTDETSYQGSLSLMRKAFEAASTARGGAPANPCLNPNPSGGATPKPFNAVC